MNGVEARIYDDAGSLIRLPHASPATASFKVYVNNNVDSNSILIKVDRSGDGVDYDVEINDSNSQAGRFVNTAVGIMTQMGRWK